jgi:hypothetical protein
VSVHSFLEEIFDKFLKETLRSHDFVKLQDMPGLVAIIQLLQCLQQLAFA